MPEHLFRSITLVILLVVGKWFGRRILYDRSTNGGDHVSIRGPTGERRGGRLSPSPKTFHQWSEPSSSLEPADSLFVSTAPLREERCVRGHASMTTIKHFTENAIWSNIILITTALIVVNKVDFFEAIFINWEQISFQKTDNAVFFFPSKSLMKYLKIYILYLFTFLLSSTCHSSLPCGLWYLALT